ncbi:MAG: family 1 glycosylhydrolase [Verrucomicrobiota bacterium]
MFFNNEGTAKNSRLHNETFRWAVGVESSWIPHLAIDQFAWTQHDRFWREDFHRVSDEIGCKWLRYSVPWHLTETSPNVFDWKWADERFELARQLGINLMVDLVHFGTPTWLPDAFGDVDFPAALEKFSRAFGQRYSGVIRSICPINEPLITAFFCGDVGLWPPHGHGLMSYTTILSRVAQALSRSIRALRETMPNVEIILCDALEFSQAETDSCRDKPEMLQRLKEDVRLRNDRRHVVLDLITGRIDAEHQLQPWLIKNGFSQMDLNWFLRNPVEIDVLGLDYYSHSEMELYACDEQLRQRLPDKLAGLAGTVRHYWERYGLPMMITETSCCGDDARRAEWLDFTICDIRKLREEGISVIGYTWWPLVDHLDWDGALLHQIGKIHRVGIYSLERKPTGELRRVPTSLVNSYRELTVRGDEAAGVLRGDHTPNELKNEFMPNEKNQTNIQLDYPIIVHCHLRWEGVWQRPQQFLSRISKNHRVLFVEGPQLVETNEPPTFRLLPATNFPNVTIMQTFFPASRFHDGGWVDAERLRLLKDAVAGPLAGQFNQPVQWFYDPMAVTSFAGKLEERATVYDCMDQLSQFKFAPPELIQRERELLALADVVFAGGRKLHESKSRLNSNCHFYGCGVQIDHFAKAREKRTMVPHDLDFVNRPILGYFGVVDERLDYSLIEKLADANPNWSVVIIGPLAKVDPNSLPVRTNIFWLGKRDYLQLPAYTKAFDVCLMPFALNEATEYINPTKALEYMAAGKQIVSSAVPDVVSNFSSVVKVAASQEEFIELCRSAVESPDESAIQRGLEMGEQNGWDSIVAKLEEHVRHVLKGKAVRKQTEPHHVFSEA